MYALRRYTSLLVKVLVYALSAVGEGVVIIVSEEPSCKD